MKNKFLDKQKEYFDKSNSDYDLSETTASRYEFTTFVNFMGDNLAEKEILDLGCGYGRFGIKLAEFTSAKVTGIDISDVSVERANNFARERGVKNFHAVKSDFKTIKDEGYYDIVLCINMLHHTNDRDLIARNVFKSLKPGGVWIVIENNPINVLFIPFFAIIRQLRAHLTLPYLLSNKYSLIKLIKDNGFQVSEILRYGMLPTMLYNYSLIFLTINNALNKLPVVNQFCAFHMIKATKKCI